MSTTYTLALLLPGVSSEHVIRKPNYKHGLFPEREVRNNPGATESNTERMKMSEKISAEMVTALRKPLDSKAITQHPTKKYLSSIKTIYSIERLNEVFGLNGWIDRYEVIECEGPMIVVKGELTIPEYGIRREAFGGNDNVDRGDAYKGACTDALSKMAAALYIGMDVYKGQPNAPAHTEKALPPT